MSFLTGTCSCVVLGKNRTGKKRTGNKRTGKKRTGKKRIRKRAHAEKSARGIKRSRKKAQMQLFQQIILLITIEFVSHINVNMKMCVI